MRPEDCLQSTNKKTETDHINYLQLGVSLHLALNDLKRAYYKCTNFSCPSLKEAQQVPKYILNMCLKHLLSPNIQGYVSPVSFCMGEMSKFQLKKRKKINHIKHKPVFNKFFNYF